MPDMPCYPYVTKEHRTIMNDRELLDWIREKAGDDMAELVDMRLNEKNCPALKEIKNVLSVGYTVSCAKMDGEGDAECQN